MIKMDKGSFRDPGSRVYILHAEQDRCSSILRGINDENLQIFKALEKELFYQRLLDERRIVKTRLRQPGSTIVDTIFSNGWSGVLEHETLPFISYAYEWSFAMFRRAALLHLKILSDALEAGWILKDSSPYNIQFVGTSPIFIDIPSFVPWKEGDPWAGYRQFCCCFLIPLMIRSHLGIDHLPLMRSYLDGIPPVEAAKFFKGFSRLKSGVLSHVIFPAKVEKKLGALERDTVAATNRSNSKVNKHLVFALVENLTRLVKSLDVTINHTDWSEYDKNNTYNEKAFDEKKRFVETFVSSKKHSCILDLGCNTGTFSKIASKHSDLVVAADADHDTIQKLFLYESQHSKYNNIIPLIINFANASPDQGWAGHERTAFDSRVKPDGILALALVHHIRISANIPMSMFLAWLRAFNCSVIIEFVDRKDEMVVKLLLNKSEKYLDYNREKFESEIKEFFLIKKRYDIKDAQRVLYHLEPK